MLILQYQHKHNATISTLYDWVQLRNETSVPVFYRDNKIWVQVWVRMNYTHFNE